MVFDLMYCFAQIWQVGLGSEINATDRNYNFVVFTICRCFVIFAGMRVEYYKFYM